MGGVINIITKSPEKLEFGGSVGYGSDETIRYTAYVGDRLFDKLSVRLGYESEETDGWPDALVTRSITAGTGTLTGGYETLDKTGSRKWVVGDKGDEFSERWNVNFNAVYDLTDTGSLAFDFQMGRREYGNGRPNTYLLDEDGNPAFSGSVAVGEDERARVSLSNYITAGPGIIENPAYLLTYKEIFGPVKLTAKAGYHHEDLSYTTPSVSGDETYDTADGYLKEFDSDVWFGDLQANLPLGASHFLISGLNLRYDEFDSGRYEVARYQDMDSTYGSRSDITQGKDRQYAIYLQDEWRILEKLTLFLGARYDYWEASDGLAMVGEENVEFDGREDSAFSPKISAIWDPVPDTILKASVGHAFRPPSLYELYRTYRRGDGVIHSNPDLAPETLWNYEIGATQYLLDRRFKLSATAFHTTINDLIYYYDEGDDRFKANAGEAEINGLELEVSIRPFLWLDLWGNYTFNDTEIIENKVIPEMEGKKITGMPESTVNLGTEIKYGWFRAGLMGRYLGRIYVTDDNEEIDDVYGAYTQCWVWDTKLIIAPMKHMEVSLAVNNLFDEEYFESYVGRERNYFVEMNLKW